MNLAAGFLLGIMTVLMLSFIITVTSGDITHPDYPTLARCQEDQVLVGIGGFHRGHYERYICGPAVDDFLGD